jgi:hypothetical protein
LLSAQARRSSLLPLPPSPSPPSLASGLVAGSGDGSSGGEEEEENEGEEEGEEALVVAAPPSLASSPSFKSTTLSIEDSDTEEANPLCEEEGDAPSSSLSPSCPLSRPPSLEAKTPNSEAALSSSLNVVGM